MSLSLDDWLRQQRLTNKAFAACLSALPQGCQAEVSRETLRMIRQGRRMPSRRAMQAIYIATGGAVDANSVFGVGTHLLRRSPVIGGAAAARDEPQDGGHGKSPEADKEHEHNTPGNAIEAASPRIREALS